MDRSAKGRALVGYGAIRRLCNSLVALLLLVLPAGGEESRVAVLGDSLTQGYGLLPEDGLVPQLQAWLDARAAGAVVVNAGVSGDTTAGGLARVGWTLEGGADAMVVALGANDMLRGIDPAAVAENLAGILAAAAARDVPVLLVSMRAAANFGPDYKRRFDAIYPALAEAHGALLAPPFFDALAPDGEARAAWELQPFMQGDGLHPNAAGVRRIVAAFGPRVVELLDRIEP